ncbi:hypothetical protein DP49_5720 [Burkholderia pseudomallei]|nr:hypothetical protein DP49_5720 [Burkholderia pseudomallei]
MKGRLAGGKRIVPNLELATEPAAHVEGNAHTCKRQ